jgi:fructuronate reductase
MKLTLEGLKDYSAWESAGIELPKYDVEQVRKNTIE